MTLATKQTVTQHITETVNAHQEALQSMSKTELYHFAVNHGFATRHRFNKYITALATINIDYHGKAEKQAKIAELKNNANTVPTIRLFTDFASKHNKFAITDAHGQPVWFGMNFEHKLEQSEGELDTAKKAIWLTGKIREHYNLNSINLILTVDAQWLTYANHYEPGTTKGGKAQILAKSAIDKNINLTVEWVPSHENLADNYTRSKGYLKYQDSHYLTLTKNEA